MHDSQFITLIRRAARTGSVTDAQQALEIARLHSITFDDLLEFRSTQVNSTAVEAVFDDIADVVNR
jgi:hypothetical protein